MPTTSRPPLPARLPDGLVSRVLSPSAADALYTSGRCYFQPSPGADWTFMDPDSPEWMRPSLGWGGGNSYGEAAAEALLPPLDEAPLGPEVVSRPSENWGLSSYATPSPPSESASADVWAPPAGVLGPTPGENVPEGHARVMASRPPTDEALRTRRSAPRPGVLYWHRPVPVQPVAARPRDVVAVPGGDVGEVVGVMETAEGVAYVWVRSPRPSGEGAPLSLRRDRVSIESRGGMEWECVGSEDRCGPEDPRHGYSRCGFPPF